MTLILSGSVNQTSTMFKINCSTCTIHCAVTNIRHVNCSHTIIKLIAFMFYDIACRKTFSSLPFSVQIHGHGTENKERIFTHAYVVSVLSPFIRKACP